MKLVLCWLASCLVVTSALLYPRESETRQVKDLSGKWKFRIDDSPDRNQSFREKWWEKPLQASGHVIDMPVPASYNDITQNKTIRDFVGWVWYETEFYAPASWKNNVRAWLRVGSAHYNAIVYLNTIKVMEHSGGHLPFECDVTNHLYFGSSNKLNIAVNNTLTPNTLPPGVIEHYTPEEGYPQGYFTQNYEFDFFNYAGVHRSVKLYTTPEILISDVITWNVVDSSLTSSSIHYQVDVIQIQKASYDVTAVLKDAAGNTVNSVSGVKGEIPVQNPHLWWPVGMNASVGYMYTLEVQLTSLSTLHDVYRLPVGIRSVEVSDSQLSINGKSFYFHGVGKHEDWDVRGKGFDWSMVIKDFNLLHWLGANSFRTSHYPYAEEIMQMCDEQGIVVIDECPAVGMKAKDNFVNATLQHHFNVMEELVSRDRNHPAVVMWSVANEPASNLPEAAGYFKAVIEHTHNLDHTRPVTFVCNEPYDKDVATPFVDVVSINKYEGWYNDGGHTEVIKGRLTNYIEKWRQTRRKPIIHMEWGAGAIAGFHSNPSLMYSEDYLIDVMKQHFAAFEAMRTMTSPYFIGEMIWNFADFATAQTTSRMLGNRKGMFTRARQPKWPAYVIRERYRALLNQTCPSLPIRPQKIHPHDLTFQMM